VLLADTVSANDALVILGGANLGAAAYEYGLARATRSFPRSRPGATFTHRSTRIGCRRSTSPTTTPTSSPTRWLAGEAGAHDWRPFVGYTLACEGVVAPTAAQIDEREALTRAKVTQLLGTACRRRGGRGSSAAQR